MKFDLEERLLRFAVSVLDLTEETRDTKAANHLSSQLIRSATAPLLLYGEANAAESPADFIHKMAVALKELRETRNCLQLIYLKRYVNEPKQAEKILDEAQQLILIFGKSINTARKNLTTKQTNGN